MPVDIERGRVQELKERGATLVEVLPWEEFEHEHLPGAVSLPMSELCLQTIEGVIGTDRQRAVIVYCQGSD